MCEKLLTAIKVILAISAAIIVIGLAGQLDHDEYIEANMRQGVTNVQR